MGVLSRCLLLHGAGDINGTCQLYETGFREGNVGCFNININEIYA